MREIRQLFNFFSLFVKYQSPTMNVNVDRDTIWSISHNSFSTINLTLLSQSQFLNSILKRKEHIWNDDKTNRANKPNNHKKELCFNYLINYVLKTVKFDMF